MWDTKDPDLDDALHNPDPVRDAALDRSCAPFSSRGWINASALILICAGLIVLFAGYPIIDHYVHQSPRIIGFNLGGINGSGQVPDLTNFPQLIDPDTPDDARTRTGYDGQSYSLVFSDEFNKDGRTFYPGDDPYWEAVDLHYWPTGDLEWYDPSAITTSNGKLVITMEEVQNHDLNFRSGMLQGWNKFCFTTGYIEVSVSMPGSPQVPGLWPAAWTMGNLVRMCALSVSSPPDVSIGSRRVWSHDGRNMAVQLRLMRSWYFSEPDQCRPYSGSRSDWWRRRVPSQLHAWPETVRLHVSELGSPWTFHQQGSWRTGDRYF